MIDLRVRWALCKLLGIDIKLLTDISLNTHVNGKIYITLTRYLSEEEIRRLEDIIKSYEVKDEST